MTIKSAGNIVMKGAGDCVEKAFYGKMIQEKEEIHNEKISANFVNNVSHMLCGLWLYR